MPAKSKAQQRLMSAAEHGATFPLAEKLRESMTHAQLHDFALGSMLHKPEHARAMHPAMKERARMASEAHKHLSTAIPGFNSLPKTQRMMAVQHHIKLRKGDVR